MTTKISFLSLAILLISAMAAEIYQCPECPKPFTPLRLKTADENGPGFDRCPKCGKQTFQLDKSKGIMMFD